MLRRITMPIPKVSPVVVRVSAAQRAAWAAAADEAGETVSELVRISVDRELERRREEARVRDPFGLKRLLEQARGAPVLPPPGRR
jgi:hypothetical protein